MSLFADGITYDFLIDHQVLSTIPDDDITTSASIIDLIHNAYLKEVGSTTIIKYSRIVTERPIGKIVLLALTSCAKYPVKFVMI